MSIFNQRNLSTLGLIFVVVFSGVALYLGAPNTQGKETFGGILYEFASDIKTKTIFVAIFVDVVTGVAASLHIGTFDPQKIAAFHKSNVLPYVLGYLMVWTLTAFGATDVLPASIGDGFAALCYGAIMTALTGSVIDNSARFRAQIVPTSEDIGYASKPTERHG